LAFPTIIVADLRTPKTVTRAMKLGVAEVLPRQLAGWARGSHPAVRRVQEGGSRRRSASRCAPGSRSDVLEREIVGGAPPDQPRCRGAGIGVAVVEAGCAAR
jgi:hypothetical protein